MVRDGHDTPYENKVAVSSVLLTSVGLDPHEFPWLRECSEVYDDEGAAEYPESPAEMELAALKIEMADLKTQLGIIVDRLGRPVGAEGKRPRTG